MGINYTCGCGNIGFKNIIIDFNSDHAVVVLIALRTKMENVPNQTKFYYSITNPNQKGVRGMRIYKRKQTFERITLVGSQKEFKKWLCWLYDNGYTPILIGPKRVGKFKIDSSKFRMIGEREIIPITRGKK